MNSNYSKNLHKPYSLNARIHEVERQLVHDRHNVKIRRTRIVNAIRLQITAPSSLLLSAGIGFIIGELTWKPKMSKSYGGAQTPLRTAENMPLVSTLKLLVSIHTLYKTLPVNWLKKTFQEKDTEKSSRKPSSRRTSAK
jgi:hypothetical protein